MSMLYKGPRVLAPYLELTSLALTCRFRSSCFAERVDISLCASSLTRDRQTLKSHCVHASK